MFKIPAQFEYEGNITICNMCGEFTEEVDCRGFIWTHTQTCEVDLSKYIEGIYDE